LLEHVWGRLVLAELQHCRFMVRVIRDHLTNTAAAAAAAAWLSAAVPQHVKRHLRLKRCVGA
jgi:hypothetical protein